MDQVQCRTDENSRIWEPCTNAPDQELMHGGGKDYGWKGGEGYDVTKGGFGKGGRDNFGDC